MPDGTANPNRINTQVTGLSKRARRRSLGVMALEPRVMYDAAAGAAVATTVLDPTHAADSTTSTATATAAAVPAPSDAAPGTDASASQTTTAMADVAPLAVTGAAPTDSTSGHQVVFIDPHVPDYQLLAAGVKPGEEVVILDPNTDGVQQIADWLGSHDEHNLDAIHIVSHGEDGTVRLGSTILATNDVNQFAQPLAQIGAALKPGGDILFYGCDVGEGAAGDMFMVEMSMATGGAHIAAASHLVGAASEGGSWDLNVRLGSIDVGNPFTDATLASFNDILTDQIWFTTNATGTNAAGTRIEQIGVDASGATDVVDGTTSGASQLTGIVVDAARGKYFVAEQVVNSDFSNLNNVILEGSLATGALDPTPIYTGPSVYDSTGRVINGYIGGLQLDAANGELYFAQGASSGGKNLAGQTGIFKIGEDGSGLTEIVSFPTTALDAPRNFALDLQDNLIFFTDNSGRGSTNSDGLGIANLTTGATSFVSADQLAAVGVTNSTGLLSGIAVDPPHGTVYFTAMDTQGHTDHNYIFSAPFTVSGSGDTATATLGTIRTLYTVGSTGAPASIVLDVPDGLFYVANKTDSPDSGTAVSGSIEVGRLDGSQPLTTVFEASTMGAGTTTPANLFLDATPTVTAGDSVTFTQNGAAVTADAGLIAADSSGQNFASATVTISGGALDGDTLTADTSGTPNITWSYDSVTHRLTLSGIDTPANYQRVLESVAFSSASADPTGGGTDTQRTLTWTVNDGVLTSNAATSTVMVHMAPTVVAGDTATFFGGGAPVTLDGTLMVSDPDGSGTLASATVKISSGFLAGDTLTFTDQNGITGSYDAVSGALSLTGTASVHDYQTALDSITYSFNPTNGDPTAGNSDKTRTITWVASNSVAGSNAVTSTVDTVHVAPTVMPDATATFIAGGPPVTLDSGMTVSDVDSYDNLASATVKISSGFVNGDSLNFTDKNGITGSYDPQSGVLTLTGITTLANYQTALKSITYSFSSGGDPTAGGSNTARTIGWVVNDGVADSNPATTSLTVHVPPSIVAGAGGAATFIAGGAPVTLDGALTVSDIDSAALSSATVKISSGFLAGDTLAVNTSGTSIAASYDSAKGVLTLSGDDTPAHYQQVMETVAFSSTQPDPTSLGTDTQRTLTWTVSDALSSAAATSTVMVHTPPTVDAGNATAIFTGGGPAVVLDGALTVGDVDSATLSSAMVKISSGFVQGDTLAANTGGTNITMSYDSTTHTLTLSGTASVQDYQKVLDSVTYSFPGNGDPTQGGNTTRTISWAVNDGVAWSSSATSTLSTVNAIHTPPTLSGSGNTTLYGKHDPGVTIDGGLTVSDPDSGGMLTGATVTISAGFTSGDTLAAMTSGTNITASYNANTGVLTLSGQDTLAKYQSVLDHVTYSSSDNNPSQGNKNPTRTITWVVNDGATKDNLSTPVTSTIDIVPELQSIAHAPSHGPDALSPHTATLSVPSLTGSDRLVTSVRLATDADEDQDSMVVPWPAGRDQRVDHDIQAAVDLRHAVVASDAELLAGRRGGTSGEARQGVEGDKPAPGKPGLLTQLRAAARHGLMHERQALIKDLHKRSAAR